MPFLSGLEAVKEIKAYYTTTVWPTHEDGAQCALPTFCLFTVYRFMKFKEHALEQGVNYVI